jgi:uncharacterized CHY-type Zn-finger protein
MQAGDSASTATQRQVLVCGVDLDADTRCRHYRSAVDVIAIKMRCCETYYACIDCHRGIAGHPAAAWPRGEWDNKAVLCGVCRAEMTVREYMDCGNRCPACQAQFNPGCRNHYHLYFEEDSR